MAQPPTLSRFPMLAMGLLTLLGAMWAGLMRIGWVLPPLHPTMAAAHGPLMVLGFLSTLIGLERAVALGRTWAYAAPVGTGVGGLLLMVGVPAWAGALLTTLGSLGVVAIFAVIVRRQPELFNKIMAVGALSAAIGNGFWLFGGSVPAVVPWWTVFLVLTIAGERLELSRLLLISPGSRTAFLGAIGLVLTGPVLSAVAYDLGWRAAGAGMLALAVWLLRHDIARRTLRQPGLPRFIAICMLSGYAWLGAAGGLALGFGVMRLYLYDAVLHSVFLGLVFSMIFGHAPVIFPAVLGVDLPLKPAFYVHLSMLHLSLLLRVVGDLTRWSTGRQWGGMLNVITVLFFLANTVWAIASARASRSVSPGGKR